MTETYSFGEWVRLRRKALDLSQRELAERASCALPTIKKIESDERHPSRELADLLAEALQVPSEYHDIFVECARGLRPVDALANIQIGKPYAARVDISVVTPPTFTLPVATTAFIGRDAELAQIEANLNDPDCHLLTLVGSGGIGKTRLAYEAAAHQAHAFPDGIYAIPLAGVNTPDFLLPTIAERLKLAFYAGDDPKSQVFNFLRDKIILLVLDNFEHLLEGASLLVEILALAPRVKLLVTSRERLNLQGEWLFPVEGLSFPHGDTIVETQSYHALQLFAQSAHRAQPGYRLNDDLPAVVHICQLTEGMPLALELAASWTRRMPPAQIAAQIQHDLDFLAASWRDVPERHRSIRALFEHSWRLLTEAEQNVLMKLAVFRGGFDADSAQFVTGAALLDLAALEDKSLVRAHASGRYDLHPLIRQYAEKHLRESGLLNLVCSEHLDYFTTWAEAANDKLYGSEQVAWTRQITTEYDNFRAALDWALNDGDPQKGVRLVNALWWYWFSRGHWREGYQWTKSALEKTEGITTERAIGYNNIAVLASQLADPLTGDYAKQGLEYARQLDLHDRLAMSNIGFTFMIPDYETVMGYFENAIQTLRETGPDWYLNTALFLYADRAHGHGDLERAEKLYRESLEFARTRQHYWGMMSPLGNLGRLAVHKGQYEQGQAQMEEAVAIAREIENPVSVAEYLIHLGTLELYRGDYAAAERDLNEPLRIWKDISHQMGIVHAYQALSELALHQEEFTLAAEHMALSLKTTFSLRNWEQNFSNREFNIQRLIITGKLACALADYPQATRLFAAGEALRARVGYLLQPLARDEYEQAVNETRQQLGKKSFAEHWAAGQSLDEPQALNEALAYVTRLS